MVTRLKEIMGEKGMTSVALAKAMGVTTVTISSMITGKTQSLDNLEKAANILGVPMWRLFVEEEVMRHQLEYDAYYSSVLACPHCGARLRIVEDLEHEHKKEQ